jgi:hypothetical protein
MKAALVAILLFGSMSVQAACPDIIGKWGGLFETVSFGETGASVGRYVFKSDGTVKETSINSYLGDRFTNSDTVSFEYNTNSCKIKIVTPVLTVDGIALTKNKIFGIVSFPDGEETQTFVLERIR